MAHILKLSALILALLIPTFAFAATPVISVRALDTRAIQIKYENLAGGSYEVVGPSGVSVRDGSLPKGAGAKRVQLPKDLASGSYTFIAKDRAGKEIARATFTIAYDAPTCRATLSKKNVERGDFVTLRWRSENAQKTFVFGKTHRASGTEKIALYHAGERTFAVNVVGKGGVGSCKAQVTVK